MSLLIQSGRPSTDVCGAALAGIQTSLAGPVSATRLRFLLFVVCCLEVYLGEGCVAQIVVNQSGSPDVQFVDTMTMHSKAVNCVRFSPSGHNPLTMTGSAGNVETTDC